MLVFLNWLNNVAYVMKLELILELKVKKCFWKKMIKLLMSIFNKLSIENFAYLNIPVDQIVDFEIFIVISEWIEQRFRHLY